MGVILNSKLEFDINIHIEQKIKQGNKIIGLTRRHSISLPRKALLTIYKSFDRPDLGCGDVLYEIPDNLIFENKLQNVQYKACLAVTGAIQRLYDELQHHSIKDIGIIN